MNSFKILGQQLLLLALLAGPCLAQGPSKHQKMSSAIVEALQAGQLQMESAQQLAPDGSMSFTTAGLQVYIEMVEVSEATLSDLRTLGVTI